VNPAEAATAPALTRVQSGSAVYWSCVDFLADEAEALDQNRVADWLEMLHPEIDYRVPMRASRERSKGLGFSEEGYHLCENHGSLALRVERLSGDYAWAEDPPSRTRRLVTNHRVFRMEGSSDLRVRSNLLLYRERLDEPEPQLLSGEHEDDLREHEGTLRLVRRVVLLDHATLLTPNLGIFL
jgi:ethylbenzene dioxygenase subunit beta